MQMHVPSLSSRGLQTSPIWYEFRLSWAFAGGDFSSAVAPGVLFSLVAWRVAGASWDRFLPVLGQSLLYFWLYIYTFCLANQMTGHDEDRINKPHRPLPQGMVTLQGAKLRLGVTLVLFTLLAAWMDVLLYAVLWQCVIVVLNLINQGRNWVVKNAAMSVGIIVQLAAAWQMVTPLTPTAWRWILFPATVIFPLVSLQDLRDMEGDRHIGRRTFPLLMGEKFTRWFLCVLFALLPLGVRLILMQSVEARLLVWLCEACLLALSVLVAVRVVRLRSPKEDHRTYLLLTYWYCGVLTSALVLL